MSPPFRPRAGVAALAAFIGTASANSVPPSPEAAVLIGLAGPAYVTLPGAEPVRVDRCAGLPLGATICTGPESFATVRLDPRPDASGANDVVLMPNTCLNIEQATATRTQVQVERGAVTVTESRANAASPSPTLAIRTRDGLAEGNTGGFRVAVEESATRTEAVTGGITLSGGGQEVEVAAGKGSRVSEGQVPSAPIDLLIAYDLLSPEAGVALIRPDFFWKEAPQGTGYRLELSADPSFTELVEAIDIAETWWKPDFLFAPSEIEGLWWRVSPYDRLGFQGVPTPARPLLLPPGVRG